jgi:hypothetical protein
MAAVTQQGLAKKEPMTASQGHTHNNRLASSGSRKAEQPVLAGALLRHCCGFSSNLCCCCCIWRCSCFGYVAVLLLSRSAEQCCHQCTGLPAGAN